MTHQHLTLLILAFTFVVAVLTFSDMRFSQPPHFTINSAGDAFLDAHSRKDAREGDRVFQNTSVVTRNDALVLSFDDVRISLEPNATMRMRAIEQDRVAVLATRGTFFVEPGASKDVTACTRQVCIQATSPFKVDYVTPGEVVHVRSSHSASVTYKDKTRLMQATDEFVIDELTETVALNGATIQW